MSMVDADTEDLLAVYDVVSADSRLIAGDLFNTLVEWDPELVVIEAVHSMPGQGVRSMFTFGRALGTVEGCVESLGVRCDSIPPHTWKQKVGVTKDKRSALALASRMWPRQRELFALLKHAGRAEAALLAVAYLRRGRAA